MTTATVEMLTATVRILQVGNRQVTLSMAKQLDRVHYTAVEPLGRVRLKGAVSDSFGEIDYLVIGPRKDTGDLVVGVVSQNGYMPSRDVEAWYKALPLLVLGGAR